MTAPVRLIRETHPDLPRSRAIQAYACSARRPLWVDTCKTCQHALVDFRFERSVGTHENLCRGSHTQPTYSLCSYEVAGRPTTTRTWFGLAVPLTGWGSHLQDCDKDRALHLFLLSRLRLAHLQVDRACTARASCIGSPLRQALGKHGWFPAIVAVGQA